MSAATILVVDDEPQIRRVMRTTLSSRGYIMLEAKTRRRSRSKHCATSAPI